MNGIPPRVIKRAQRDGPSLEDAITIDKETQNLIHDARSLLGLLEQKFETILSKINAAQPQN